MNASSDSKGSEQDLEGCCKDLLEVTQRRRRDFHTPQSWGGCRHGTRSRGGVAARGSTLSSRGLRVSSHHTRLSRPLWTLRLGVRATVVGHSPLSVIDLLRLLVAEEKQDGTEEEDGCPPAHPIRPAKLPQLPIALLNLGCKACWVDHQGDQDAQHWRRKHRHVDESAPPAGGGTSKKERSKVQCQNLHRHERHNGEHY